MEILRFNILFRIKNFYSTEYNKKKIVQLFLKSYKENTLIFKFMVDLIIVQTFSVLSKTSHVSIFIILQKKYLFFYML